MDLKIVVKIGQLQHGRLHQNAFQGDALQSPLLNPLEGPTM